MKRFTAILTALAMASTVILAGFSASAQNQKPDVPRSPFQPHSIFANKLHRLAVPGSTPERLAAMESLTPQGRKELMDKVAPYLGSALLKAARERLAPKSRKPLLPKGGGVRSQKQAPMHGNPKSDDASDITLAFADKFGNNKFLTNSGKMGLTNLKPGTKGKVRPDMLPPDEWGNRPPHVSMAASPTSGSAPLAVNFTSNAYDPDGYIVEYFWDFGDGEFSYDVNTSHTYYAAGSYTATITVTDDWGDSASSSAIITVNGSSNQPPQVVALASPVTGIVPLTVSFFASAFDPDGYIASYSWNFGDGSGSAEASPMHTYQSAGGYTASVTVTDNGGASASSSVFINVTAGGNLPPQVSITFSPGSGFAPLTVNFIANASDPDGYIVSYSWDFGDGQGSSVPNPSHTYQNAGTYTSSVTVTDNAGAAASSSVGLSVLPSPGGTDADADGLPDDFENRLADAFTPFYHVSGGEFSSTGFTRFFDFVPQTPIPGTLVQFPPISHLRVKPLGFATDNFGNPLSVIRLDYITAWNRDDGLLFGSFCNFALSLLISSLSRDFFLGLGPFVVIVLNVAFAALTPHDLDDERSSILVAAPTSSPGVFNTDPNAYSAYGFYTAAHEYEPVVDHSTYFFPFDPVPANNHIQLWLSKQKHATYFGDPSNFPLLPFDIIYTTYDVLGILCDYGILSFFQCLAVFGILDTLFFDCLAEHFSDVFPGTFAGTRVNVGEPGRPLNASGFIEDLRFRTKLTIPVWFGLE
jgi:PKD repeat protein